MYKFFGGKRIDKVVSLDIVPVFRVHSLRAEEGYKIRALCKVRLGCLEVLESQFFDTMDEAVDETLRITADPVELQTWEDVIDAEFAVP